MSKDEDSNIRHRLRDAIIGFLLGGLFGVIPAIALAGFALERAPEAIPALAARAVTLCGLLFALISVLTRGAFLRPLMRLMTRQG